MLTELVSHSNPAYFNMSNDRNAKIIFRRKIKMFNTIKKYLNNYMNLLCEVAAIANGNMQ